MAPSLVHNHYSGDHRCSVDINHMLPQKLKYKVKISIILKNFILFIQFKVSDMYTLVDS